MGIITNMRTQRQVVMWAILILFIASMAVGGLVGGASVVDIFGQNSSNNVGSLNGKPILVDDFDRLVFDEISRIEKQSGENMNDADREYVRAVVWERLIQDLLIQEQIEENKKMQQEKAAAAKEYKLQEKQKLEEKRKELQEEIRHEKERAKDIKLFLKQEQAIIRVIYCCKRYTDTSFPKT